MSTISKKIAFSICLFLFLWMYEGISISYATDVERVMTIKPLGMAAFTAVADARNAVIWNPAGLSLIDRMELNFVDLRLLSSIVDANSITLVSPISHYGVLGLNVNHLNYGNDISSYDKNDEFLGQMTVADTVVNLSYGREIFSLGRHCCNVFSLGVKGKGIWLNRKEERSLPDKGVGRSTGLGVVDIGLLYRLYYSQHNPLSLGICAQDIGITKLFREEKQILSYPTVKTGIATNFGSLAFGPINSLTVAADADFEIRKLSRKLFSPEIISLGLECYLSNRMLGLRGGLSTGGFAWDEDEISFFLGLSFKIASLGLDYAYSGHSILADNHIFSLSYIRGAAPIISLNASQASMPADENSSVTITATIQNGNGSKKLPRTRMVTFEVDDDSICTLEGKKRITVKTINGKAEINLLSTENEGIVTINASSPGLEETSLDVKTAMSPKSEVQKLSEYTNSKSFKVAWTGSDKRGSGIKVYEIQYKDGKDGEWTNWLEKELPGAATFGPDKPIEVKEGHTYYFRSIARDNAGNLEEEEDVPEEGDTHTTVDTKEPVISVLSPPDGSTTNNATPNISAAITDTVSGVNWEYVEMTIDGILVEIKKDKDGRITLAPARLSDGKHTVTLKASDKAGNSSPEKSWAFNIVTTLPTVRIEISPTSPVKAGEVNVTLTVAKNLDAIQLSYMPKGEEKAVNIPLKGTGATWIGTVEIQKETPNGEATFSCFGLDEVGNTGELIVTDGRTFVIDTQEPIISDFSWRYEEKKPNNAIISISVNVKDVTSGIDESKMSVQFDEKEIEFNYNPETGSVSCMVFMPDGLHTLKFEVSDMAGNSSKKSWNFTTDTIPPTAEIEISPKSPVKAGEVNVTLTASENLNDLPVLNYTPRGGTPQKVELTKESDTTWKGTMEITGGSHNGEATFSWKGTDEHENTGTEITGGKTFIIDTNPPTIGVLKPPDGMRTNNPSGIIISARIEDSTSGLREESIVMSIDGTRVTHSYEGGIVSYRSSEPLEDHEYAVKLNVSDKAGNIAVKSWTFTVDTIPPTVVIQTMPSSPVKPESVTVKLIASKNLRDTPKLTFKPPVGSSKGISLKLEKGNTWKGEINITPEMGHGTGTFVVSGVDLVGNRGTEITGGQTFEIAYGYLKIGRVEPWADIYIDGNKIATTPYALEIPVRAGKRLIKLKQPPTGKECEKYHDFEDGQRYTLTGNLDEQEIDVKSSD